MAYGTYGTPERVRLKLGSLTARYWFHGCAAARDTGIGAALCAFNQHAALVCLACATTILALED